MMDYLRDPQAIYDRSFAIIREETNLDRFTAREQAIAIRMIHACGMTDIVDDLLIADGFVEATQSALRAGSTIYVDSEMLRHGIITRHLKPHCKVICTLNEPQAAKRAQVHGITRSAAAVDLWSLPTSLAVIGNAPTALFRLLERVDAENAKPAAIIGLPVGFVGAAESKAELAAKSRGVPFLTLRGRRGGSAMACAVINALAGAME